MLVLNNNSQIPHLETQVERDVHHARAVTDASQKGRLLMNRRAYLVMLALVVSGCILMGNRIIRRDHSQEPRQDLAGRPDTTELYHAPSAPSNTFKINVALKRVGSAPTSSD